MDKFVPVNVNGHCWHPAPDPNGPGMFGFVCCHCAVRAVPKYRMMPAPEGHGPAYPSRASDEMYLEANEHLCRALPSDKSRPHLHYWEKMSPGLADKQCGSTEPHPPHPWEVQRRTRRDGYWCFGCEGEVEGGYLVIDRDTVDRCTYGYWRISTLIE